MLVTIIVACEVGFWVFIAAGLIARYPLRRPRLGAVLLICAPVVDLILLGASAIDLSRGAPAEVAHGLAAAYIGFSVAFGHGMIRWADERFAHRFAAGRHRSGRRTTGRSGRAVSGGSSARRRWHGRSAARCSSSRS